MSAMADPRINSVTATTEPAPPKGISTVMPEISTDAVKKAYPMDKKMVTVEKPPITEAPHLYKFSAPPQMKKGDDIF